MNYQFINDMVNKINNINQQEREKYNAQYLPTEDSINILEQGNYAVKQSLSLYKKIQSEKQSNEYRRSGNVNVFKDQPLMLERYDPVAHQNATNQAEYNRSWSKLDKQQKLNRLMAYVNKLRDDMQLNKDEVIQLRTTLVNAINNKIITRKNDVEYCDKTASILKIPGLMQNDTNRHFYIGRDDSSYEVTKVTSARTIKQLKKLDLSNLTAAKKISDTTATVSPVAKPKIQLNPTKLIRKKIQVIKKRS